MNDVPQGLLSLTYHLAYDDTYRNIWMAGQFETCFDDFGITDDAVKAAILKINNKLGTADPAQRDGLVDQWMGLVGEDVKHGAANPKILW
jgi:hypothetical protein